MTAAATCPHCGAPLTFERNALYGVITEVCPSCGPRQLTPTGEHITTRKRYDLPHVSLTCACGTAYTTHPTRPAHSCVSCRNKLTARAARMRRRGGSAGGHHD